MAGSYCECKLKVPWAVVLHVLVVVSNSINPALCLVLPTYIFSQPLDESFVIGKDPG